MSTANTGIVAGHPQGGARPLPMIMNSVSVIGGKVATMGLGFLFWLLAARTFTQAEVGLAAAAVSAMMLCTQLAIFGVGSALITRYPEHIRQPRRLFDNAVTLASAASLLVAGGALVLAALALRQLAIISDSVAFATFFIVACLTGTLGILLDQASIALRRGDQVLLRGLAFGAIALASLGAIAWQTSASTAMFIFVPWVAAGAGACLIGSWQLHRALAGYRYRPRMSRGTWRDLVGVGLPNWALTMTERTPGLVLPVVVTEVLSPADNAAWYAAWMMAWVLFVVPISIGLTLFAEATHRPDKLRRAVRLGIGCALAIGIVGGLAMAVLAPYLLSLLGEAYATAGTEPLRILLLSVVPLAFTQAYFAISRARRRLGEAIVVGVVSALVSVVAAVVGGMAGGLDGIAVAWTVTQTVTGLVAFQRIRGMWRSTDGTAPSAGFTDSRVD